MIENLYVKPETLRTFAEAPEADGADIWNLLAESASRLFDRACGVEDGFFNPAAGSVSTKIFPNNGTKFLRVPPYIAGSIIEVLESGTDGDTIIPPNLYFERDGFLIFTSIVGDYNYPTIFNSRAKIKVTARFGFSAIPADVKQAVIEQALMMWRRKDLAFTELSGVSTAVAQAAYSPTFQIVAEKYRELYSGVVIG